MDATGDDCRTPGDVCTPAEVVPGTVCPTTSRRSLDHFEIDANGDCCPAMCGDDSTEDAHQEEEQCFDPGDPCMPTDPNDTACPVARCTAPPDGCQYKFDAYVFRDDGRCCPKLCFAVDNDGNECNFTGDSGDDGSSSSSGGILAKTGLLATIVVMIVWSRTW